MLEAIPDPDKEEIEVEQYKLARKNAFKRRRNEDEESNQSGSEDRTGGMLQRMFSFRNEKNSSQIELSKIKGKQPSTTPPTPEEKPLQLPSFHFSSSPDDFVPSFLKENDEQESKLMASKGSHSFNKDELDECRVSAVNEVPSSSARNRSRSNSPSKSSRKSTQSSSKNSSSEIFRRGTLPMHPQYIGFAFQSVPMSITR